jgi:hypothetical protein
MTISARYSTCPLEHFSDHSLDPARLPRASQDGSPTSRPSRSRAIGAPTAARPGSLVVGSLGSAAQISRRCTPRAPRLPSKAQRGCSVGCLRRRRARVRPPHLSAITSQRGRRLTRIAVVAAGVNRCRSSAGISELGGGCRSLYRCCTLHSMSAANLNVHWVVSADGGARTTQA